MDYLYNFPNASSGMDDALVDFFTAVPILTPMFLLFVFLVVMIGGSSAQSRRTGMTDLPMWSALASLSTLLIAVALSMISGMMSTGILVIVVVVTILSGLWLFLDRNSREV